MQEKPLLSQKKPILDKYDHILKLSDDKTPHKIPENPTRTSLFPLNNTDIPIKISEYINSLKNLQQASVTTASFLVKNKVKPPKIELTPLKKAFKTPGMLSERSNNKKNDTFYRKKALNQDLWNK